ncbi:MAG: hypothetical protein ABW185_14470 [Sedimenticola sp.]
MTSESEDVVEIIQGTVSAMSDSDKMVQFCLMHKVGNQAVEELLKRGYTSLEALQLVVESDLDSPKIARGQRRLILHIAGKIEGDGATGSVQASAGLPKAPAPPAQQASAGMPQAPALELQGSGPSQGATAGDVYSAALLSNLIQQQSELQLNAGSMITNTSPNSLETWNDPQVHISTAAQGKSSSDYHDICDFVPNVMEEEMLIGGQGDQQLVVKSGPRKPKLENVSFTQWSIANLAILYRLVQEGKLNGSALMDYLSYTTKVYQLVQRFSMVSVLAYDREYRKLQSAMGFRWGTDVQHLHTLCLQSRDKIGGGSGATSKRPQQTPQVRPGKSQGRESGICRSFNS